jgi:hypothetical protein
MTIGRWLTVLLDGKNELLAPLNRRWPTNHADEKMAFAEAKPSS